VNSRNVSGGEKSGFPSAQSPGTNASVIVVEVDGQRGAAGLWQLERISTHVRNELAKLALVGTRR